VEAEQPRGFDVPLQVGAVARISHRYRFDRSSSDRERQYCRNDVRAGDSALAAGRTGPLRVAAPHPGVFGDARTREMVML